MEKADWFECTDIKCQNMCCYNMASTVMVPQLLFQKCKYKAPGSWNDWFISTEKHI